ncbi:hypothetical protein [Streptomyces sp. NPDC055107]
MRTGGGTERDHDLAVLAGEWFVETLNEGLARSAAAARRRSEASPGTPFARAVLAAVDESLTAVLDPAELHDPEARSTLLRHAGDMLRKALADGRTGRPDPAVVLPALPRPQAVALNGLVVASAARVMLRDDAPSPGIEPARLMKALGLGTRSLLRRAHDGWVTPAP